MDHLAYFVSLQVIDFTFYLKAGAVKSASHSNYTYTN